LFAAESGGFCDLLQDLGLGELVFDGCKFLGHEGEITNSGPNVKTAPPQKKVFSTGRSGRCGISGSVYRAKIREMKIQFLIYEKSGANEELAPVPATIPVTTVAGMVAVGGIMIRDIPGCS
jgi:hypothetical protein